MDGIDDAASSSALRESMQSHQIEQGNGGVEEAANSAKLTIEHAKNFLNTAKERLKDDQTENYDMLLVTLRDFYLRRSGIACVKQSAIEALMGHADLVIGFNAFLPNRYEITLDELRSDAPLGEVMRPVAFSFLAKVKERFRNDVQVYQSFLQFLRDVKTRNDVLEAFGEVAAMFEGHRDLFMEFTRIVSFLEPNSIPYNYDSIP